MLTINRFIQFGAVATTLLFANAASAITVDSFQFGGGIQVANGSGATPASITFPGNFTIGSQNETFSGDLIGLTGDISGSYDFADPAGSNVVALTSATAGNTFTINDGVEAFAADVALIELQGGGGGAVVGAIDFSSSSYSGANADLIVLNDLIQNTPDLTITFQLVGAQNVNLDSLFLNGLGAGTYSGVVNVAANPTAVPEPGSLALLGMGLLCSAAFVRRRSSSRRSNA